MSAFLDLFENIPLAPPAPLIPQVVQRVLSLIKTNQPGVHAIFQKLDVTTMAEVMSDLMAQGVTKDQFMAAVRQG